MKFPAVFLQYEAPLLEKSLVVSGLRLVRNEVRLGAQTATCEATVVNRTDRDASSSKCGVLMKWFS